MSWRLVFTKQAQKDAKKLAASQLKPKAQILLEYPAKRPIPKSTALRKTSGRLGWSILKADQHSAQISLRSF